MVESVDNHTPEAYRSAEKPRPSLVLNLVGMVFLAAGLVGFIVPLGLALHEVEWSLISWHAVFMTVFAICATLGISVMQGSTSPRPARSKGFIGHRILQVAAVVALAIGLIFTSKDNTHKDYSSSLHQSFGVCVVVLLILQAVFGITVSVIPRIKFLYKYHRALGYIVIVFAWLTVTLGVAHTTLLQQNLIWINYAWITSPIVLVGIFMRMNVTKITNPGQQVPQ